MKFDYESLLDSGMEKMPKREGTGKRFKRPRLSEITCSVCRR